MEEINIFSPLKIRNLTLKNRIVVSPMQQYSSVDGKPSTWHLVHLGSRAVGGAGLIITECTAISQDGLNTLSDAGIWNNEQVEAWKPIVKFVQEQGTKIAVQLWHSGGKGSHSHPNEGFKHISVENGGWITKSSSAVKIDGIEAVELTISEIEKIKEDFISSAKRAIEAGFDAIEIHAAHGYLLHQFYSAIINHRTDKYGGSFENRIRLLLEIIEGIRKVIPNTMPLLVRLSSIDFIESEDAWTIENSIELSKILKSKGVDFITASAGGFTVVDKSKVYPNYQLPFATDIKNKAGILTGAVGIITNGEQANKIIINNEADLVVIGREFLRNPYFPLNIAKELKLDIEVPFQYKRAY